MIHDHDRAGWFGASDTAIIMGRYDTKTFAKWWAEKLGLLKNDFSNHQMRTGTHYEHKILDFLDIRTRDRQRKIPGLRIRVNYDGEDEAAIYEVKTYGGEAFQISSAYRRQCNVEAFVSGKPVEIVAYRLLPEDYRNWFNPIDGDRISYHPIPYDKRFIDKYIERVLYLNWCMDNGVFPQNMRKASESRRVRKAERQKRKAERRERREARE